MKALKQEARLIALNTERIYNDVIDTSVDIAEPASEVALELEQQYHCSITTDELETICAVLSQERKQHVLDLLQEASESLAV